MSQAINGILTYLVVDLFCAAFSVFIMKKLTTDIGSELEISMQKILLQTFIVYSCVDALWILGEYGYIPHYMRFMNGIICFLYFAAISVIAFFTFAYTEIKLKTPFVKKHKLRIICALPIMFSILISASSYYTGWVFCITADNRYVRGPYYIWQMVLIFSYYVIAALRALQYGVRTRTPLQRKDRLNLSLAIMISVAVASFQVFFPGTPLIEIVIFSGFLIMFVNFQQAQIFSDALTELNNRRRASQYLESRFNSPLTEWPLYLFIFDIDLFKKINDTYGHIEGDKVLRIVAQVLRIISQKYNAFTARFGGDEFLLIAESLCLSNPDELIHDFNKTIDAEAAVRRLPYKLSLSIGYAKTDGQDMSPVAFIKKADDMLYKNKGRSRFVPLSSPPPTHTRNTVIRSRSETGTKKYRCAFAESINGFFIKDPARNIGIVKPPHE